MAKRPEMLALADGKIVQHGPMQKKPLRILTFSTLFPNAAQPNHGIFVANRLQHLLESQEVDATVVAPVPWFPSANPRFGAWSRYVKAPAFETRGAVAVHHPRFILIPWVGMSINPSLLYFSALRAIRRLMAEGLDFDLIDAHYVYPDGVAAVWIGRKLGKPVVLTARGSDMTQLPDYVLPRIMIRQALLGADALISVSAALGRRMIDLGAPREKVTTLRNGVDTRVFHPVEREVARATLGWSGRTILSVGALIPRKAHHLTIGALVHLPDIRLVIAGEGAERNNLMTLAARLGVADRVHLPGNIPHAELATYYAAADVSVLASTREGWANVLLESMACGTPVVASDIPGNDEVVSTPEAGLVVAGTEDGIAAGVRSLLARPPDRERTIRYAQSMSWDETSAGQVRVFAAALAGRRA